MAPVAVSAIRPAGADSAGEDRVIRPQNPDEPPSRRSLVSGLGRFESGAYLDEIGVLKAGHNARTILHGIYEQDLSAVRHGSLGREVMIARGISGAYVLRGER